MKEGQGRQASAAELKFWTSLKTYFFCEEDEQLHWSDMLWLIAFLGFTIYGLIVVMS